jgi:4-amino-4-deoxy-L-arabinose transferase-like glycosyltransferase
MVFLKKHLFLFFLLIIFLPVLSYHLLQVPIGFSSDEAAFGYNATLLSRTLHDENHRFLPFFVLSLEGKDWRQPVTQYYQAIFFRLFGASPYNLRFSSVVLTLLTAILIYCLAQQFFSKISLSLLSALCYLTVPIVFIQAHYGLDNNMTVPFTVLWVLGLFQFTKTKNSRWLLLSAVSLGISFYTYKGMRAVVPIWCLLTVFYLLKTATWRQALRWSLFISPFFLIIPYLQVHYPGAVFDGQRPQLMSYYNFFYPYISSFDPGFLFITGDATPYHTTGHHGMFLLFTLPFFLIGIYACLRKNKPNYQFLLLSFFFAPILMGFVDSVHRASRTMCLVPFFVIITIVGLDYLWHSSYRFSRLLVFGLSALIIFNFVDFFHYYHTVYAPQTQNFFGRLDYYSNFAVLKTESQKLNLKPAIGQDYFNSCGDTGKFYEAVYFTNPVTKVTREEDLAPNSLLLTQRFQVPGLTKVSQNQDIYYFTR